MYSLNHELNACAFPSVILSKEYVIATNGDIIVKNAIFITLLKYKNVNLNVYITNAVYIIKYPTFAEKCCYTDIFYLL